MELAELIKVIDPILIMGPTDLEISGLSQDSRYIKPGNLFFCIKGVKLDGHRYLTAAIAAGAAAVVVEDLPELIPSGITLIQVKQSGETLQILADKFYDYPQQKLKLIGVIGTNGKTTSTFLMKSVLEAAGHRVGLIGTIMNLVGDVPLETNGVVHNTTPGRLELLQIFAQMVQAGVEYVVLEVSSHSIHQGRVAGFTFNGGIYTNITQDHLDYHGTFDEYLKVKSQFFSNLPVGAWASINRDDKHWESFASATPAQVLTYGINHEAQVKAGNIVLTAAGASFTVQTFQGNLDLNLNLTGYFNVYNTLGVITGALALGVDLSQIKAGLEKLNGVPGRFERVNVPGADVGVIVDYAHTPDGLENILKTGRGLNPKRLTVVFGCGGDRDRTKRPIMGKIAADLADNIIITSDNPRSENPETIISEVVLGMKDKVAASDYAMIADRQMAIRAAIAQAVPGELIIIAGKGHETEQIFADVTIHFDDREFAKVALEERIHG